MSVNHERDEEMEINMNSYMPVRLITGRGCVRQNADKLYRLGKKALIVTGKNSARACGALTDVFIALKDGNSDSVLFDRIGPNPALTDCMEAAALAAAQGCDYVIGIGGGSPLDAAKCIAVLAANPGMTREELYSLNWPNRPLPIACVGTTAGTGSEVTKVSVITVPEGRKKSFHHEDIFPAVSFGDPAYTDLLPFDITCSTAIDALSHALESYFSRYANELSKCYSIRAVRMLLPELEKLSEASGSDSAGLPALPSPQSRDILYHASLYGGMAINQTGTCLPHAMGYFMTEQYNIPHGYACAIFLPAFLRINEERKRTLAVSLYNQAGTSIEHMLGIIRPLLRKIKPVITEEDIAAAHSRWIGNSSIAKGWGEITADECDEILRSISSR